MLHLALDMRRTPATTHVTPRSVEVIAAGPEQRPVLSQLLELYTYEFSFFCPFDLADNGHYGYPPLELYWSDTERAPYLVWVGTKLAGFALVHRIDRTWDVAEFFILPRFRKQGVGQVVAERLWDQLGGSWIVRVMEVNKAAHAFWDKAIAGYAGKKCEPRREAREGVIWFVYEFTSRATDG